MIRVPFSFHDHLLILDIYVIRNNVFSATVTPLIIVGISLGGYQYYGSSSGGDDDDDEVNL